MLEITVHKILLPDKVVCSQEEFRICVYVYLCVSTKSVTNMSVYFIRSEAVKLSLQIVNISDEVSLSLLR